MHRNSQRRRETCVINSASQVRSRGLKSPSVRVSHCCSLPETRTLSWRSLRKSPQEARRGTSSLGPPAPSNATACLPPSAGADDQTPPFPSWNVETISSSSSLFQALDTCLLTPHHWQGRADQVRKASEPDTQVPGLSGQCPPPQDSLPCSWHTRKVLTLPQTHLVGLRFFILEVIIQRTLGFSRAPSPNYLSISPTKRLRNAILSNKITSGSVRDLSHSSKAESLSGSKLPCLSLSDCKSPTTASGP